MNLLNLAPRIQEEILLLPEVERGKDRVTERQLRRVVESLDWRQQQATWIAMKRSMSLDYSV